ncbi:Protein of uncharacterised function (DUF2594) [Salmonella enterica subsp. arizonae]|uniref:Protein of uncharacterized function (DUF2594) n=1 Tax=Salmonella enterica subsp. arizonae TaxID=59203 RepID=A0A2X4TA12_SALER|nr:Protein of uncharacterised function (DUF2594) [Salmonella enterica subsp. arizonae]
MSTPDFSTAENNQELATEVNCLKAMFNADAAGDGPGRCRARDS